MGCRRADARYPIQISIIAHGKNILAGENKSTEDSKNSSSGWNAGVVFSLEKETGFGITVGANKGKGKSEGNETYYANSVV